MTKEEFDRLAAWAFSPANPGYKSTVREAPAGDGVFDEQKEYAHIAPKYFTPETPPWIDHEHLRATVLAARICRWLGLENWLPGPDSTLRLLRYPPGATTAPHTDFDLFTLSLYRSHREAFQYLDDALYCALCGNVARLAEDGYYRHASPQGEDGSQFCDKYGYPIPVQSEHPFLTRARELSPGIHFGELMTEILRVPATRHATSPLTEWSSSAVFFVIPDHSLKLPSGVTVGEWIKERVARSRKTV